MGCTNKMGPTEVHVNVVVYGMWHASGETCPSSKVVILVAIAHTN